MKRFFVFLFMLLATFSLASAQTIDIKGTVIDENGEPVIGASVMIKGTLKGDITDVSGRDVAFQGSLDHHRRADDGFSVLVDDGTFDVYGLG